MQIEKVSPCTWLHVESLRINPFWVFNRTHEAKVAFAVGRVATVPKLVPNGETDVGDKVGEPHADQESALQVFIAASM